MFTRGNEGLVDFLMKSNRGGYFYTFMILPGEMYIDFEMESKQGWILQHIYGTKLMYEYNKACT